MRHDDIGSGALQKINLIAGAGIICSHNVVPAKQTPPTSHELHASRQMSYFFA
jgi:hypothetical protein